MKTTLYQKKAELEILETLLFSCDNLKEENENSIAYSKQELENPDTPDWRKDYAQKDIENATYKLKALEKIREYLEKLI